MPDNIVAASYQISYFWMCNFMVIALSSAERNGLNTSTSKGFFFFSGQLKLPLLLSVLQKYQ